jgi:hypothetical protein
MKYQDMLKNTVKKIMDLYMIYKENIVSKVIIQRIPILI